MKTPYQIQGNEDYFSRLLKMLKEGGAYGFVVIGEVLVKKGRKFQCSERALGFLKGLVSEQFFENNFELKK